MYEGFYEEHGLEEDLVVLNMNDLTGGSLYKIQEIVRDDAEGEENRHAAKKMNAYLEDKFGP